MDICKLQEEKYLPFTPKWFTHTHTQIVHVCVCVFVFGKRENEKVNVVNISIWKV